MPGIHVRSLGKLDWVERGNEPVLTIPGAYWLCHKKHIYKFTFKWHKSLRNTEGFAYPKELTKVIRRIIKSQPRQGQQFGTRHLLVTYNHSAWMRQDKMFAMLKFRERSDATAFPHAFVLTVQTLNGSSAEELCEPDPDEDNTHANTDEKKNVRVQGTEKTNKIIIKDDSLDHQTKSHRYPNFETNDKIDDFGKTISSEKFVPEKMSSSRNTEMEREKDPVQRGTRRPKSLENVEDLPPIKRPNRRGYVDPEKNKLPPDSPAEKGIAADFADLPYQYIIEKEIEASKCLPDKLCLTAIEADSAPGPSHKESDLPGKSLPRSPRAAQAETARSANITDLVMEGLMFTIRQDQDSVTVVEQKTKLEMDEVLENSEKAETKEGEKCLLNSSLLRLESLITKIEMSEARHKNNEAIPRSPSTIANDRNIAESFLDNTMNYENSICGTKYDIDVDRVKPLSKIEQSPVYSKFINQLPVSPMPKFPLVKINLSNVKNVLSDRLPLDYDAKSSKVIKSSDEAMEVDQDITIDVKANESRNLEIEDEEEEEVGLELKYEEKDDSDHDKDDNEDNDEQEEEIVPEALQPKSCQDSLQNAADTISPPTSDALTKPRKNCLKLGKTKTPRIVSNEIVTDDQIPPALKKALHYKRLKRMHHESENIDRDASPTVEGNTRDACMSQTKLAILGPVEHVLSRDETTGKPINTQPSSTIDITEEFERELMNEKSQKQPVRRKSPRHAGHVSTNVNQGFTEESEIRLDMWKFMQDITRGAKVVVRRLDLSNIPSGIVSVSSLAKYESTICNRI